MVRSCLAISVVLILTSVPETQSRHPATLTPDGGGALALAGQASRADLLGALELYDLAIYTNGRLSDRASLASPETPKALRIAVTYKPDLRRRVTLDWQRELIPPVHAAAVAQLRSMFSPLKADDVVVVEYVPGKGTAVWINRTAAVSGAGHDLILAFLDHWIGQRPVSEDMKTALLTPISS